MCPLSTHLEFRCRLYIVLVAVVLFWRVIVIHVLRALRDGILDADGALVPFLFSRI
jgi:hypothetical protein